MGPTMKKISQLIITTSLFIVVSVNTAFAGVVAYTDKTLWENALAGNTFATNEFDGSEMYFLENSLNNDLGTAINIDLIGGVGDPGPTGIAGNGFFQGEVDSSSFDSSDGLTLKFNTSDIYGLAFEGIQDSSVSSPGGLDLEEIGFAILGEQFLLSDILGLSNSSDGTEVPTTENTQAIPFIGFVSSSLFTAIELLHGDFVAPGSVSGSNEAFYIDSMTLAGPNLSVPAPSSAMLFAVVVLFSLRRYASASSFSAFLVKV